MPAAPAPPLLPLPSGLFFTLFSPHFSPLCSTFAFSSSHLPRGAAEVLGPALGLLEPSGTGVRQPQLPSGRPLQPTPGHKDPIQHEN